MTEAKSKENVRVVVRCRPMNGKERACGYYNVITVKQCINTIEIVGTKEKYVESKSFTFDGVYDCNASQQDIYRGFVQPVIDSVLNGFNGTIFAYGQTGTGKTHTMEGNHSDASQKGVIPNTFKQIYDHIAQSTNVQYLVRASYVEIYQEEVKDLLSENKDKTYELISDGSGIHIKDLKSRICKNSKEMEAVMEYGKKNRKVGATDMNEHSSRSHAIFTITIEMSKMINGMNHIVVGKLNLVDLAGSERQSKSCASGYRLKEASKINLSLSALGNVVSALSSGKSLHIPYRDSKLTRLLQDSLGGNAKTLMIANIGPASYNYEESLTTLRYANRAKNIRNKPIINEDPKDALIRQYQEEIGRLKNLLQSKLAQSEKDNLSTQCAKTVLTCSNKNKGNDNFKQSPCLVNINELTVKSLSDDEKLKQIRVQAEQHHKILVEKKAYIIETLERQIKTMQSKLLHGTNIEQHTKNQEEILKIQEKHISDTKLRKIKLKLKLEKEEETTGELQDSNTNLLQDIDRRIEKLNKLQWKLQMVKDQTVKSIEEFNTDRNDLELAQKELIKEYKLNQIIIENFVPISCKKKFMSRVYYDDSSESWKIDYKKHNTISPAHNVNTKRNESVDSNSQSKIVCYSNARNKNIIAIPLEPPIRTVCQYEIPLIPRSFRNAIDQALEAVEEDITLDAAQATSKCSSKEKSQRNPYSLSQTSVVYPKVRGLVKRK